MHGQEQPVGRACRASGTQVVQGVGVFLLQRTLAQQLQQLRGIRITVRVDMQFGLGKIGDGCRKPFHPDFGQPALAGDGEPVADESDIGVHVVHGRPIGLELELAVVDFRHRFKTAVVVHEGPIIQVAGNHSPAIAHLAALQGAVQPIHCTLGHLVMDPEPFGRRHRCIVDLGGDIDPRPRAIALEPQAATCMGTEILAAHAQRRRTDTPARALTPTCQGAVQSHVMGRAESCRPVETQARLRVQGQGETFRVANQFATHAVDARRMTCCGEADCLKSSLRTQRLTAYARYGYLCQVRVRLGMHQPLPQSGFQAIAQAGHGQQRCRLYLVGKQCETLSTRQHQAIQFLGGFFAANAQTRRVEAPTIGSHAPTHQTLHLGEIHARHCSCLQQGGSLQTHLLQVQFGSQHHHLVATQFGPAARAPTTRIDLHPGVLQQRNPFRKIHFPGIQVGTAIAAVTIEVEGNLHGLAAFAGPHAGTGTHAFFIHAQAQVDARQLLVPTQAGRNHGQARIDDLQFTQPFKALQRITAGRLPRQSQHGPRTVLCALQRQRQTTQAQFGERTPRQQACVHRHQHFGLTDAHGLVTLAHAQAIQAQQGTTPGPLRFNLVERHGTASLFAQPRRDFFGMAFSQRQDLAGHAQHQRHQHQYAGDGIPDATARQADATTKRRVHQLRAGKREAKGEIRKIKTRASLL